MLEGTRFMTYSDLPELPPLNNRRAGKLFCAQSHEVVVDVAERLAKEGKKVALVQAASAYHAGGGFTTGGRHALEEAFCSQSTLYPSLEKAEQLWTAGVKK